MSNVDVASSALVPQALCGCPACSGACEPVLDGWQVVLCSDAHRLRELACGSLGLHAQHFSEGYLQLLPTMCLHFYHLTSP